MGTQDFQHRIEADTPDAAFRTLVAEAEAEWGHQGGYSGAINQKRSFRVLPISDAIRKNPQPFIDRYLDERADKWDDWAYAIDLGPVTHVVHTPGPATRCTTTVVEPHTGPVRWETVYEITGPVFAHTPGEPIQFIQEGRATKTEAIKRAKELALTHQTAFRITVAKKPVHREILEVAPKPPAVPKNGRRVTTHRWIFFGSAPD